MKNFIIPESQILQQKVKKDKYRLSDSEWVASFSCSHLKILIVCRGPIRKEAMDVFTDMGAEYGILLSEKDSVTYPHTLAPELRVIKDQSKIHRVTDYAGAGAEEKKQRIREIIKIASDNNYTHIFAGYGFMAEDHEFVEAIEEAGVGFIGPASNVHRRAGSKDTAKKLARSLNVSVTPGIDNISALTLITKSGGNLEGLKKTIAGKNINLSPESGEELEDFAERVMEYSYAKSIPMITMEDMQKEAKARLEILFKENPGKRFRLKYIGGGGGKGQRIVTAADQGPDAVTQILQESRATSDTDNRNFLIEINIEETRHNEIQLLGNGQWCISLGGRDCSVQMHEQKLLEISITDELYQHEISQAKKEGRDSFAAVLEKDRETLIRMEEQAETFGQAVGLNSASTFECIVSGNEFYFMEMNTRIQVEHRVTEMAYTLRFENPYNDNDFFVVESLVEAMVLLAAHGNRIPEPVRVPNNKSGGEVRLNATDDALQPHAGGIIEHWSPAVDHEIRDDQGIGVPNPDTGSFINYNLAGAYDSNVALIVTYGSGRRENLERLSNILRQKELRGQDLKTNLEFHYGLLSALLGIHPMLKTETSFVNPYLAAVGSLAGELAKIDPAVAWEEWVRRNSVQYGADAQSVLMPKLTLITRPLREIAAQPHLAMGWLLLNYRRSFDLKDGKVNWLRNPLRVLNDLYYYLRLEERKDTPPSLKIWPHDLEMMEEGLEFYRDLDEALGIDSDEDFINAIRTSTVNESKFYGMIHESLMQDSNPFPSGKCGIKSDAIDDELFIECQEAHRGWQLGLNLLELIIQNGYDSGVLEFSVDERLKPIIPAKFLDRNTQKDMIKHLSPPPKATANEIVAVSGGMFYSRETPDSPRFMEPGKHFNAGDPIYIIEVMKMFNRIVADFSGTVDELLVNGDAGVIVKKGDPLFRVTPDEVVHIETEEEKVERIKKSTLALLDRISIG